MKHIKCSVPAVPQAAPLLRSELSCLQDFFRTITGLPIHSYFPAFKLKWLYENVETVRK